MVFEHRQKRVRLLFADDKLLVEIAVLRKSETRDDVRSGHVPRFVRECGSFVRDQYPGKSFGVPGDLGCSKRVLFGFRRNPGNVAFTLPRAPVFLYERKHLVVIHISDDKDRGVVRPVEPGKEFQAVIVLIGHVLDICEETHRGVLVCVRLKCLVPQHLCHLSERAGAVLVVFAEYGPRLGAKILRRVLEMLKPVGFQFDYQLKVFLRVSDVIRGVVIACKCISAGSGILQELLVLFVRVILGAAEHHVLEEVGKARLAGFHLVARPGLDDDPEGDQIGKAGRHGDHSQAIGQVVDEVLVREYFFGCHDLHQAKRCNQECG